MPQKKKAPDPLQTAQRQFKQHKGRPLKPDPVAANKAISSLEKHSNPPGTKPLGHSSPSGITTLLPPLGAIDFRGELFSNPNMNTTFRVLAGEAGATIKGGYSKWQVIDRPQRTGLSTFTGYDPTTMTLAILFNRSDAFTGTDGGWRGEGAHSGYGVAIEEDIKRLEWMAGRGSGIDGLPGGGTGLPPKVTVKTTNSLGDTIPLIPLNYQNTTAHITGGLQNAGAPSWVITDIAWDESPLRDDEGYRVRQAAVVTLLQWVDPDPVKPSAAKRSAAKAPHKNAKITIFHVGTSGLNTIAKIAALSKNPAKARKLILAANQNSKPRIQSVYTILKVGRAIRIPAGLE